MLIEFTVENYRSFYSKKTLVMEADKAIKECQRYAYNDRVCFVVSKT